MGWLPIVLVSYFLLAISSLVDKIFLSRVFSHPMVYVLWVSLLSLIAFLALPGFAPLDMPPVSWIGWYWFWISMVTGAIFTLALWLMYTALQRGEASRVIPFIGGAVPVIVFVFSYLLKIETFTTNSIIAFALLMVGSVMITIQPHDDHPTKKLRRSHGIFWALSASTAFATFFLLTAYIFGAHTFTDGIVWPRVGTLAVVIVLMMHPHNRELLSTRFRQLSRKMRAAIITNQGLAAIGFLGQNYAIEMGGGVSLITALQGVQYAFILVFAAIITVKWPSLMSEKVTRNVIIQKIIALGFIAAGLYYISF